MTECTAAHYTCGTCTHWHRTSDCNNLDLHFSTPCSMSGHASWDRSCPVFQSKCDDINTRTEENQMPYFPMPEVWTQVKEPLKVIYIQHMLIGTQDRAVDRIQASHAELWEQRHGLGWVNSHHPAQTPNAPGGTGRWRRATTPPS